MFKIVQGKALSRYLCLTPLLFSDLLETVLNRGYNFLEWGLASPAKPHAFIRLSLQSRLIVTVKKKTLKERLKEWFSKKNLFTTFIVIITGILLRHLALKHFHTNVFRDYNHWISIVYYSFMTVYAAILRNLWDEFMADLGKIQGVLLVGVVTEVVVVVVVVVIYDLKIFYLPLLLLFTFLMLPVSGLLLLQLAVYALELLFLLLLFLLFVRFSCYLFCYFCYLFCSFCYSFCCLCCTYSWSRCLS